MDQATPHRHVAGYAAGEEQTPGAQRPTKGYRRSVCRRSYRRALAVAEQQCARFFELRAGTSLARLWCDQGKIADAHNLLAPIYGWFTEGFGTKDLIEAKALLDELGAALGRNPAAGMAATART